MFKKVLLVYKAVKEISSDNTQVNFRGFNGRPEDFLTLQTPNFKTKYSKRVFEYNGSRLWNALPYGMRVEEDVTSFKKSLKTLLFDLLMI